jgi:hypothetical protein
MWASERRNEIYTLIKHRAKKNLVSKYSQIYFTQNDELIVETQLPTVYVKTLPGTEIGRTIEGKTTNGFLFDYEIKVTVGKEQGQVAAEEVIWEVCSQFKKMGFWYLQSPSPTSSNNAAVEQIVARMRRNIGASDRIQF